MLDACNNIAFLRVVYFIKQLLNMAFILIPIALILILTVDFSRNVMANGDDMKKNLKIAIKRLIYAVVIFLVPFIVRFAIENFVESDVDFLKCYNVSLDSIKEQIKQNKKECESSGTWDPDANECLLNNTTSTKKISYGSGSYVFRNSSSEDDETDDDDVSSGSEAIDKAIAWAKKTAKNQKVGYSQRTRYLNPNVDCSSFVYYSLVKGGGFSTKKLGGSPFNTSSMTSYLKKANFKKISLSGKKVSDLKAGDILWRSGHTELYVGNGKVAGAHQDYDGKNGDGSGKEVNVKKLSKSYLNIFTHYFRYKG